MGNLSNVKFKINGTLTTSGTSVAVSNDLELDTVIEAIKTSVVLHNSDKTIIERMEVTFSGGTMTILKRGLTQGDTKVESVALKKEWRKGSLGYITILASDVFDLDAYYGQDINADIRFYGQISLYKPLQGPYFSTLALLNAYVPLNPVQGAFCIETGLYYDYKGGAWIARGDTGTPNASTTVAGKVIKGSTFSDIDIDPSTNAYRILPISVIKAYTDTAVSLSLVLGENMTALDLATIGADGLLHKYLGTLTSGTLSIGNAISSVDSFLLDTNKIVLLYVHNYTGSQYTYKAVIGTISGSSISRGTAVTVTGSGTGGNGSSIKGCKLAIDKFAVAICDIYYGGNQAMDDITATVCSVSGTVITPGTSVGCKSSNNTQSLQDIIKVGTDKFVIHAQYDGAYNLMCFTCVGGTTITKGAKLGALSSTARLCYVSDDIFLGTEGSGVYRYTISGTTITQGNSLLFGITLTLYKFLYISSTQQIISGLNGGSLKSIVINGTPTTPTKGGAYTIKATTDTFGGICIYGSGLLYNTGTSGVNEYIVAASISGTIIYIDNTQQISSTTSVISLGRFSTGRYVLGFATGNPTIGFYFYNNEYNTIIGFLNETGTSGQSKSISKKGSVLDGFGGLIPGYKYYIYSDYSLKPDNDTGTQYGKEIGIALTSTKLLVTV